MITSPSGIIYYLKIIHDTKKQRNGSPFPSADITIIFNNVSVASHLTSTNREYGHEYSASPNTRDVVVIFIG